MKRRFPWFGLLIAVFSFPEMLPEPNPVTPEEQKRREEEYPYYEMLFWEGRDPGFSGM